MYWKSDPQRKYSSKTYDFIHSTQIDPILIIMLLTVNILSDELRMDALKHRRLRVQLHVHPSNLSYSNVIIPHSVVCSENTSKPSTDLFLVFDDTPFLSFPWPYIAVHYPCSSQDVTFSESSWNDQNSIDICHPFTEWSSTLDDLVTKQTAKRDHSLNTSGHKPVCFSTFSYVLA